MRCELKRLRSRPCRLVLAAGIIGAAVSACSQDATRLSEDPFGNPFRSPGDVTHSIPPSGSEVERQPLAGPPAQPAYNPPPNYAASPPRSLPAAPAPSYPPHQAARQAPATTGSAALRSGESGWYWDGGSAVTLQAGENVDTIARRYGVPTYAILQANNLADPYRVQPGTRLLIPTYRSASLPAPATAAPPRAETYAPQPAYQPPRSGQTHVVNMGDTLYSLGRRYGVSHAAIAEANGLHSEASLRVGQRLAIPASGTRTAAHNPAFSAPPAAQRGAAAPAPAPAQPQQAAAEPAQKIAAVTPADLREEPRALGGSPQFRWPVRGRVISGYGPKANGQHNDGINVAVPEGTEIKAAEDGVVAYSGNELKGYGNLVLLRHSDGWMTAYAHNSQLLVKRGDSVRRGQTIARAGQTGGVSSPQLHFEIRRGSTPVDPTKYLAGL